MFPKPSLHCLYIIALAAIIGLLAIQAVPVHAQCGIPQPSSCAACHAREDPVNEKGEWHIIHASKDICINCHGGNGSTLDKNLAHEGLMAQPLADIYTDCHSCHPDYSQRADRFAWIIGITPASCPTPTPAPFTYSPGPPPAIVITVSSRAAIAMSELTRFAVVLGGLASMTIFVLALGWLNSHQPPV